MITTIIGNTVAAEAKFCRSTWYLHSNHAQSDLQNIHTTQTHTGVWGLFLCVVYHFSYKLKKNGLKGTVIRINLLPFSIEENTNRQTILQENFLVIIIIMIAEQIYYNTSIHGLVLNIKTKTFYTLFQYISLKPFVLRHIRHSTKECCTACAALAYC